MAADLSRLALHNDVFAPFPNKATFVLALMSNNPRRPFSTRQIKTIILSWQLPGVPNVPTYDQYKATLDQVRITTGSRIVSVMGLAGTQMCIKPIADGIIADFANPLLRPHLQLYAWRSEIISSYQDSDHALANPSTSVPMIEVGLGRHAYVDEVLELREGYCCITSWYEGEDGQTLANGIRADRKGHLFCVASEAVLGIDIRDIVRTGPELLQATCISEMLRDGKVVVNEHPLRRVAAGKMVYRIPLYIFLDDLSGASSKRWNKHLACSVQNAALPADRLSSDATIRLFAASEKASVQEISQALAQQIKSLHEDGIVCWDVLRQESVLIYGHIAAVISDNPMAAELASNIGMKGKFPCRCCNQGGSAKYRESAEGLAAAAKPGEPRTTPQLVHSLTQQISKAGKGYIGTWSAQATSTGVKDKLTTAACERLNEEYRQRMCDEDADEDEVLEEVDEIRQEIQREGKHRNPLFQLHDLQGFDVTRDLPCEILHTVLLGTVKYLMRATVTRLTAQHKADLGHWLEEANMTGIGDSIRFRGKYALKHAQSLVGKDFKRLTQIMPWALQQITAPEELIEAWTLQGQLAAALHVPVLKRSRLAEWITHLRSLMQAFFVSYARIVPAALPRKPKLHLLTHAINDLLRFGPLPTLSAERFESFNAIVRQASIFSNRKQPSRDIARRLADEEMMRGLICGGVYTDHTSSPLRSSGPGLRNMFSVNDALRADMLRMYGLEAILPESNSGNIGGEATASRNAAVRLRSGDWAEKNSFVMVGSAVADQAEHGRQGAQLAKVVDVELDVSSSAINVCLLKVRLLRWSAAQRHWSFEGIQDGARTIQSRVSISSIFASLSLPSSGIAHDPSHFSRCQDALAVVNTNHDCVGQGCSLSLDRVRHCGDLDMRVGNECAFRSAMLTAEVAGLWHNLLDDAEMGSRLWRATGATDTT
ncbi:hypothetical protein V8E36_005371 [Tilletia maclaganii]